MCERASRFLLLGSLFLCGTGLCGAAEATGYEGATSPEALASSLEAEAGSATAEPVTDGAADAAETAAATTPPETETGTHAEEDTKTPPAPTKPFVGLWQSQRPAPPMWLDIKPNGQAYRCYVEDAGQDDTDVYASNGTLADDRIAWKILWGKERVTVSGESLVLKGKSGGVFYAKTKEPLPAACDGSDQAGTVERKTRSFNR